MNSAKLKEKNRKVYEKFYTENNFVISLPLLLNWAWDLFDNYKWVNIKQKLPLRIYIWINRVKERNIKLKTINYYDLNEEKFIESNILEYAPFFSVFNDYINNKYRNDINKYWWLEISILSEASRWLWLGFIWIVTLLFFIWLESVYKNTSFVNSEKILINDFLNINTPLDNLFRLSLEVNKKIWRKISIENQISSFFDSYYPIVSFTENIDWNISNINIDNLKIYGHRLNNLEENLSSIPFIPLDYGLIYSGRPVLVDHILNTNNESYNWTLNVNDKLKKYFWKNMEETLPIRKPQFYSTFAWENNDIFKETYWRIMWAISLELLNTMTKLYSSSYTESSMRNFIDVINKIRYWNNITRKSSKTFTGFIDKIFKNFRASLRVLWLAPNDTTIMGWNVIFAMPLEGLRKDLLLSIEDTKKSIPWSKLFYANWLDWLECKWFVIEQDLKNNVYSEFVSKNSIILENSMWISKVIDTDFLSSNKLNWLTLDLIKRKIYLDWEKLTSKQIHSQNTTIDILKILLSKMWEDVSNKDFPQSSYSTNKNEMLWKIVLPLLKIIEKEKKIKLPFICKWSLSDFYLKLKPSDLEINIIKKLS